MSKKVYLLFNKTIEKIENMWDAGIWDSLKVVQTYIKDAISIAGLVMSIECIAVRKKDYKRKYCFEVIRNKKYYSNNVERKDEREGAILTRSEI